MALSVEEKAQLQALMAKDKEPEENNDFDVDMMDENGRSVRMPYSRAKGLLSKWGFDIEDLPKPEGNGDGSGNGSGDGAGDGSGSDGKSGGRGYFTGKNGK